jgi:hypothetical protein
MFIISSPTKYEYLFSSQEIPYKSENGIPLKMDLCQGYAAMFFGKLPFRQFGKKYAYVYEIPTKRMLSLDEWTPEIKRYFEEEKQKFKLPFKYRFGWLFTILGTFLFIVLMFAGLLAYLLFITKK